MVHGVMLDILQQIWSGYLSSWTSSILGVPLSPPMTTPIRCDTKDNQFLVQETMPHDVMPLEIGYLSN